MLPPKLAGGESIKGLRGWLNQLRDHVRATTPFAGAGVSVDQTPGGTRISTKTAPSASPKSKAASSGETPAVCLEITGSSGGSYEVDIYGDGFAYAKTASGTLQALNLALASTLSTGERYVGSKVSIAITGDEA